MVNTWDLQDLFFFFFSQTENALQPLAHFDYVLGKNC